MSAIFAATRASLRNTRAPTMMLRRSLHIENTPETVRIHSFFLECASNNVTVSYVYLANFVPVS